MAGTRRGRACARALVAVTIVTAATVPVGAEVAGAVDPVAQPSISVPDVVVGESESSVTIPVTLNAPGLSTVTVQYSNANGGATSGSDYTATSGTLSFSPGETTKNVVITLLDGVVPETFETFTLNLANPTSSVISKATAQVGIVDNDTVEATPALYARDVMVDERSGSATVVVMLGGPGGRRSTNTVTAAYGTANTEALAGSDFTTTSGTLTFTPGQTVKRITVPITDDTDPERAERFRLTLSSPMGATLGDATAMVTIGANDGTQVSQPTVSVPDLVTGERDGYLDVPVSLSTPGLNQVAVQFSNSNGNAVSGSDYRAISGTLRFEPGETVRVLRIPLIDDTEPESFQSFSINVANPVSAFLAQPATQVNLADDDGTVATPALFLRDAVVDETTTTASVPVIVGGPAGQASSGPITVAFTTSNLEATAGDYTTTSGTLRFNPGQTVKHITVPITDDDTAEPAERIRITLSAPTGATLGDATGTVTIGSNDSGPVAQPTIATTDVLTNEGDGYLDLAITLNARSLTATTVQYSNSNGTAVAGSDYRAISGTLRFEPGQTTRVLRLQILDPDVVTEPVQHFLLNLANPGNGVVGKPAARINIVDNDTAGFSADYTTTWSATELPRLQQTATYMEMTVEELQKAGIGLFAFVFALSNPRPPAEVATPPALGGPNAYTTHWTSADIGLLWDVQAQYSLTPEQAQKFGVNFITFLLILGGH